MNNTLKSKLFNNKETSLLFALRSKLTDFKVNFKSRYSTLRCQCENHLDSQKEILECEKIREKLNDIIKQKLEEVKYDDIYCKDVSQQQKIVFVFDKLVEARKEILCQDGNPSTSDNECAED